MTTTEALTLLDGLWCDPNLAPFVRDLDLSGEIGEALALLAACPVRPEWVAWHYEESGYLDATNAALFRVAYKRTGSPAAARQAVQHLYACLDRAVTGEVTHPVKAALRLLEAQ